MNNEVVAEANKWIELDHKNQQVVKPMLDGKNRIVFIRG